AITQYLFYNKSKPVSREVLTEMFWPEADKKSGSASMRSALYSIRKLLAESGITSVTEPLIHENNGFLVITRPDIITTDVEQFLSLDREIRSIPAETKNDAMIIASLEKMLQLYNEDFLTDGIYDDWAYYEREKLKSVYLSAVFLLVSRYEMKGEPQKAEAALLKALSLDPYNEELGYSLLKIYIGTNRYNQAVKFYSDFKKMLLQDLDIEPDARFESLFCESAETVSAG
ncbi:MAG: BTAD domain-containing putative transcriptional regulator, partial [Bacillota bacterium]|nr:BTAD domain-containing putative transcriptional regulator [Bacillota bacterium]